MNSKAPIRLAAYLIAFLGVPVAASMVTNQTVSAVLGIVYILLLIPFGILRMIDFYRTNDGTTFLSRIFNALFRLPLALFGLVCLVAGVAIIGWVLDNVLVERQKESSGPSFVFSLGSFGVGVPLGFMAGSRCGRSYAAEKRLRPVPKRRRILSTSKTRKSPLPKLANNRT